MPGLILLLAAAYIAACLYRPMRPFESRREVLMYGVPGLVAVAVLLAVFSPPDDGQEIEAAFQQPMPPQQLWQPPQQMQPQPAISPEQLSRQQQFDLSQRRINKIRGTEEERLDNQIRDAARTQPPQAPAAVQ
jgi:hypothetical protein